MQNSLLRQSWFIDIYDDLWDYQIFCHTNNVVLMKLKPKEDIDGKWGFVDENGVWQISPLFDNVEPFIGDYARASAYGKSFYINKQGKWYKEIPTDPEAPEDNIKMETAIRRSALDILMDGLGKVSDALHKGLKDCD